MIAKRMDALHVVSTVSYLAPFPTKDFQIWDLYPAGTNALLVSPSPLLLKREIEILCWFEKRIRQHKRKL